MSVPTRDEVPELPEDLLAVCLDANSMSKGRLDLGAIQDLLEVIDDQELDIEIWIPEPVLWEWAEHLAGDLVEARAVFHAASAAADAAGVGGLTGSSWNEPVDIASVVTGIEKALEEIPGVLVLRLSDHPSVAIDGIRDQVLVQGAARKKSNVKTGAADGASFGLAEAVLARRGGSLLVVSGDQDAGRYFAGKRQIQLVNSVSRAKAGIVAMRTGSEVAVERVKEAIATRLPRLLRAELGDPDVEGGESLGRETRFPGRVVASEVKLESVDRVLSVGHVDVSRSDGYAAAAIDGLISVERELQVLSDFSGLIEMDVEVFDGLRAHVEVSAESDDSVNWEVKVDKVHLA